METLTLLCQVSIAISLVALITLHIVSREFQASWRMISEYANGKHKWLITLFFLNWGFSSFFAAAKLWPQTTGIASVVGVLFLLVAGLGEIMGALFDIKHKLHGLSFMLGVPALPIAALLVSYNLDLGTNALQAKIMAHTTWLSLLLMGISMAHMMRQFKKAGLPMGPEAKAPEQLPAGMTLFSGYANRLLVLVYQLWVYLIISI